MSKRPLQQVCIYATSIVVVIAAALVCPRLFSQIVPAPIVDPVTTFHLPVGYGTAIGLTTSSAQAYFLTRSINATNRSMTSWVVSTDRTGKMRMTTVLPPLQHTNAELAADDVGTVGVSRTESSTGLQHITVLGPTGTLRETKVVAGLSGKLAFDSRRLLVGNAEVSPKETNQKLSPQAGQIHPSFEEPYERLKLPSGRVMFIELSDARITLLFENGKYGSPFRLTPPEEDASPRSEVTNGAAEAFLAAINESGDIYIAVGTLDFAKGIAILRVNENGRITARYRFRLPSSTLLEQPGGFNPSGHLLPLAMRALGNELLILSTYGNFVAVYDVSKADQ